ncbi:MAG TPA: cation:proton antiporter [Methanoregulaceae archaeon]|jgi:NhaP-type Na+/H+ or K+/H+ antiporter|nr:sodium:proton antiporter [Methanomicrobiales archaeon]HMZ31431.1 cation:proton antiporter [Methanoregulaceae archaeon]HNI41327.1 cation:proton antiporter [Methanoregulaceae archaeon]HNO07885.1 cation:proton antiporter [Methanoregulaceae archaeon]HNW80418.1 cation:proton antiporter [Methanoregulaceae archaeon]
MLSVILVGIIIFSIMLFAYSLVSHRIESSIVTAPMIFVAIGMLVSPEGFDIIPLGAENELILVFAEIALVLILFSDAARIDVSTLKGNRNFPSRLLGIGLPLTIFLGAVMAILFFTDLSLPEAALIGVILAPTDAGLGQVIVNSPKVPARIRQALNVESGLNDGGAIPFFAFFLVLSTAEEAHIPASQWVIFAFEQIGYGVLVGLIVGLLGAHLINKAIDKGLMRGRFQWIGFLALAVISYVVAIAIGGSGFIAAFVGGFATTLTGRGVGDSIIEFTSTWGEVFSLVVFFVFGMLAASLLSGITATIILYAALSLTLIRILPVAVSLMRTGLKPNSILFIGWFGPRGLASIVLLLITLNEAPDIPGLQTIAITVTTTVLISVFAHGISANPAIAWYAKKMALLPSDAVELKEVVESPTRMQVTVRD